MSSADTTPPSEEKKPASQSAEKEAKFLGMPISGFVIAILSAILGFISAIGVVWWTNKEPHLTKQISELLPFQGEKGETGILNFTLNSDGSKEAEDINGSIKVEGSTIEDVRIVPEIVQSEKTIKGDTITIKVKTLNAGESLQVSALVRKSVGLPNRPTADFRGKGVVAVEKPAQGNSQPYKDVIIINLFFVLVATIAIAYTSSNETKRSKTFYENRLQDQETARRRSDEDMRRINNDHINALEIGHRDLLEATTKTYNRRMTEAATGYENLLAAIREKNSVLTEQNATQREQIAGLRTELATNRQSIDDLKKTIEELNKTIEELRKRRRKTPPKSDSPNT